MKKVLISVRNLSTRFGTTYIHEQLDLDVYEGEVLGIIDDWMDYYNKDRYQWELAKLSPNEYYKYITTGIYPIKGRKAPADMDEEEGN